MINEKRVRNCKMKEERKNCKDLNSLNCFQLYFLFLILCNSVSKEQCKRCDEKNDCKWVKSVTTATAAKTQFN